MGLADYFEAPRAVKLREVYGVVHGMVSEADCFDLATGQRPIAMPASDVVHSEVEAPRRPMVGTAAAMAPSR
jgi:hypothetical protein